MAFNGSRNDYEGYGRFLARTMLSKEERKKFCWFAQRSVRKDRIPASEEEENVFRGKSCLNCLFRPKNFSYSHS